MSLLRPQDEPADDYFEYLSDKFPDIGLRNFLPEQFFSSSGKGQPGYSEKRLMVAVIEQALVDTLTGTKDEAEEAADWFLSEEQEWEYAFESLCSNLGINAEKVRIGVATYNLISKLRYDNGLETATEGQEAPDQGA